MHNEMGEHQVLLAEMTLKTPHSGRIRVSVFTATLKAMDLEAAYQDKIPRWLTEIWGFAQICPWFFLNVV